MPVPSAVPTRPRANSSRIRRRAIPERWVVAPPAAGETADALARELRLSAPFAALLAARGLSTPAEAADFLNPRLDRLPDPETLPDMPAAVDRIEAAVRGKEPICLFGDYDADGLCATALLAGFFWALEHRVTALVPEREQGGYGLSGEALARIRACRPRLLITLDNGVSSGAEIAALRTEGVDAVVVDHHHVGPAGAPTGCPVIVPQRAEVNYPFRDLCGAGLAFKLAWALAVRFSGRRRVAPAFRTFLLEEGLALAGLGTVGDVVPLNGENRILAAHGLRAFEKVRAPGLAALRTLCRIEGRPSARDAAFRVVPRLNAAGRCGQAAAALELLMTRDPVRAEALARDMDGFNRDRQETEGMILEEARDQALAALACTPPPAALVLCGANWHPGVIGIVAARLVEEFHRPAVLLAANAPDGAARGSGRSIKGLHLAQALEACVAHLSSHGGHALAAGLTVQAGQLAAFRAAFEAHAARTLSAEDLRPALYIDAVLPLAAVSGELCRDLEKLEPCGAANPQPVFAAWGVQVAGDVRLMGAGEQHLSFFVRQGEASLRAVGFGQGEQFNRLCALAAEGPLDLAFRAELNTFRGATSLQLNLVAFRQAEGGRGEGGNRLGNDG